MREPAVPPAAASRARPEGSQQRHIPALDGVRGFAILLVLMVHLYWSNSNIETSAAMRLISHVRAAGWVGVDLFFALSGFLITGILFDTLHDPRFFRNFYARRSLRIFPLYYGFLLLLVLLFFVTGDQWHLPGLLRLFTYTINLSLEPILVTWANWINVNHFWSLAVEEQFYLVWPLLVFALRTRRRIAIAAGVGAATSLGLRLWLFYGNFAKGHPFTLYSWTPARLDGLLTGALLAMAIRGGRSRERVLAAAPWVLAASLIPLVVAWNHDGGLPWDDLQQRYTWGLTMLGLASTSLIAWTLREGSGMQRVFAIAPLRFFGRYSYGIYVYHYTILAIVVPRMRPQLLARTGSHLIALMVPGTIAGVLSVAAAWLSFRYFEAPILTLKRRFHSSAAPAGEPR